MESIMVKKIISILALAMSIPIYCQEINNQELKKNIQEIKKDISSYIDSTMQWNRYKCLISATIAFQCLWNIIDRNKTKDNLKQEAQASQKSVANLLSNNTPAPNNPGLNRLHQLAQRLNQIEVNNYLQRITQIRNIYSTNDFGFYANYAGFITATAFTCYYGYYWISDSIKAKKEKAALDNQADLKNGAK